MLLTVSGTVIVAAVIIIITNPEGVFFLPRVSQSLSTDQPSPRAQNTVTRENMGHRACLEEAHHAGSSAALSK